MSRRAFDVVIWGATGFTGRLVAKYFAECVSPRFPSLRWALAGRNEEKLHNVRDSLVKDIGGRVDILVGSLNEKESVSSIVSNTSVVLSTAGPFLSYSVPIVDACVRERTHYVDITGETPFVRHMMDKGYHEIAAGTNTFLVPGCGFDSIPSDLGCLFAVRNLQRVASTPSAERVRCFATLNGKLSGGTVETFIRMHKLGLQSQLDDPYLLGGETKGVHRDRDRDPSDAEWCEDVNAWTAPFMMAPINTRVVRRSAMLFAECDRDSDSAFSCYGSRFRYEERALARSKAHAKALERQNRLSIEARERMREQGSLPSPGEGPDEETRQKSTFEMLFLAEAQDGTVARCTVSGGDPGYEETAKMVSEAAVLLSTNVSTLRETNAVRGGVLTPARAFGANLVRVLHEEGIAFEARVETPKGGHYSFDGSNFSAPPLTGSAH